MNDTQHPPRPAAHGGRGVHRVLVGGDGERGAAVMSDQPRDGSERNLRVAPMGHAGRPLRSYVPNSGFDSRDGGQFDWADQLALDICADMAGRQHTEARSLIAARLRRVKAEGFVAGRWPSDEAAS